MGEKQLPRKQFKALCRAYRSSRSNAERRRIEGFIAAYGEDCMHRFLESVTAQMPQAKGNSLRNKLAGSAA